MSNLLSTSAMVTECQARVPIGLSSTFWNKKLNEAFRWISQKGNFIWDVKYTTITITGGNITFPIPSDCDPGKPMVLVGPIDRLSDPDFTIQSSIPYVPWDVAADQRESEMAGVSAAISCWTFATNFSAGPPPVYSYTGHLFPTSVQLSATADFRFSYHTDVKSTEYTYAANTYFPTPNSFDTLLIELAEAEARRIYGLAGWDIIQKRAESAIMNLLDAYRSTKNVLAGLTDQQKQTSERKLMAQERS